MRALSILQKRNESGHEAGTYDLSWAMKNQFYTARKIYLILTNQKLQDKQPTFTREKT